MSPEVVLILVLNIGTGRLPRIRAEQYAKGVGDNMANAICAKERGIEIITIACPEVVGLRIEIVPLKALLEGKYVLKEEIKIPEMEEVLAILKTIEKPQPTDVFDASTLMDSATGE